MAKLINAYDLLGQIGTHLEDWDYTGQSGFELFNFVREIINEHCPYCCVRDEFFEGMCEVQKRGIENESNT